MRTATLLWLALLGIACGGEGQPPTGKKEPTTRAVHKSTTSRGITLAAIVPQRATLDGPIPIVLKLRNESAKPVQYWRWSHAPLDSVQIWGPLGEPPELRSKFRVPLKAIVASLARDEEVTAEIDLNSLYEFRIAGTYHVSIAFALLGESERLELKDIAVELLEAAPSSQAARAR